METAQTLTRSQKTLTLGEVFREQAAQEVAGARGKFIGFFDWASKVPEPKTGPLRFDIFPPQRELYEEGADDKDCVVMKCTQVGISAWAMRWALFHADTKGRTGLYVFPTDKDMYDYSTLRVSPLIEGSSYLTSRRSPDDPDNKGMKGLGLGVVVFRGSESKTGLDSVDADHIVFDEYDTLNQRNIPDAEMRLSSPLSPGLIRRVGVPMYPDSGIDAAYQASDQRRWHVKCEACGEWQTLDFWKNVDFKTAQRICAECQKPLDVSKGEWVAEFPDRPTRGYHFSRLIIPAADLTKTIELSKKRSPGARQVFYNKHLGIAWAPAEGRLSKQAIRAAQDAGGGYAAATDLGSAMPQTAELVTMGVDVASVRDLNVRISSHFMDGTVAKKRALFIGTVESFNDLDTLFGRFGVHMAAIDHLPEGRLARAWAERHPGRIYLVAYDSTPAPRSADVLKVDDDMAFASVRRTAAIDSTFELIRTQRNQLPINLPDGYEEQLGVPLRLVEEDEFGKKTVVYRSQAPDDYAHAEVYDTVASALWDRRLALDELEEEEEKPLEDMLEFERSTLHDYTQAEEYFGGPGEDDYGDSIR